MQGPRPSIEISDKPVEIPKNRYFAEWTKEQQKAFFETPQNLKIIRKEVEKKFHIPQQSIACTLESPLIDNKGDHYVINFRVADTREDKKVRHPDIITVEFKCDLEGNFISLPTVYVAHHDRSAETRSQELQRLTNGEVRDLKIDF